MLILCKFTVNKTETTMAETTDKQSPWKDAKVKKDGPTSKELWSIPEKVKEKTDEVQKFKKNNPSSLNQTFDAQP